MDLGYIYVSRAYGRGFNRYIGPGPGEPRKSPWISEWPHSLIINNFFFIGGGWYFQLKSSILREVSVCPRGPKAVMFRLAKFLLDALYVCQGDNTFAHIPYKRLHDCAQFTCILVLCFPILPFKHTCIIYYVCAQYFLHVYLYDLDLDAFRFWKQCVQFGQR